MLKSKNFWACAVLTLVVLFLLVKLGFWQLSRGYEKQRIESQLEINVAKDPIDFDEFLSLGQSDENMGYTGQKVKTRVTPVAGKYLLLDNQTLKGNVGYLAYQLMVSTQGRYFLLERGFVKGSKDRSQLPTIEWLSKPESLQGRIYQRLSNPLSNELGLENTQPIRVQNLNMGELEAVFGVEIKPYLFQPIQQGWLYPQPWQPVPLSSQKHFGYALQWFSMAMALVILIGWVLCRAVIRIRHKHKSVQGT
ncbi:SURF1 family protein [Vibrio sp. S4M6]|uniref:SURF1 family protein n=1 Tax=Vibrio sinus TaxID=2946865 RepID=UPI002029EFDE|nr:SURF1 family protein [Vibrio sinus]MCL9780243.1 SURF1 family protein [Vibrio sinus]